MAKRQKKQNEEENDADFLMLLEKNCLRDEDAFQKLKAYVNTGKSLFSAVVLLKRYKRKNLSLGEFLSFFKDNELVKECLKVAIFKNPNLALEILDAIPSSSFEDHEIVALCRLAKTFSPCHEIFSKISLLARSDGLNLMDESFSVYMPKRRFKRAQCQESDSDSSET